MARYYFGEVSPIRTRLMARGIFSDKGIDNPMRALFLQVITTLDEPTRAAMTTNLSNEALSWVISVEE